jgi:hypothetical protein
MVRFPALGGPPTLPVCGKHVDDLSQSVVEFSLLLLGCLS